MSRNRKRIMIGGIVLTLLSLPTNGQETRLVLDVSSTDVSVIGRQLAYLERHQGDYAKQLAAVKEACPLVYAHLRLLELADLNLLTDPAIRQALTMALAQTQYRMPYVYAQKLSMSENSPLVLRNFKLALAVRNCGTPARLVRVRVSSEGALSEERGIDDALKMWFDCINRQ